MKKLYKAINAIVITLILCTISLLVIYLGILSTQLITKKDNNQSKIENVVINSSISESELTESEETDFILFDNTNLKENYKPDKLYNDIFKIKNKTNLIKEGFFDKIMKKLNSKILLDQLQTRFDSVYKKSNVIFIEKTDNLYEFALKIRKINYKLYLFYQEGPFNKIHNKIMRIWNVNNDKLDFLENYLYLKEYNVAGNVFYGILYENNIIKKYHSKETYKMLITKLNEISALPERISDEFINENKIISSVYLKYNCIKIDVDEYFTNNFTMNE